MENNTPEQNATPTNNSHKKMHIQKPNNKVVFGILALFVIALAFILVYIFALQEEEDTTQRAPSYDTIVETQDEYDFVYLGNGADLVSTDLNVGLQMCNFAVKGHPDADALLAEFNSKDYGSELTRNENRAYIESVTLEYGYTQGVFGGGLTEWDMKDYSTSFIVGAETLSEEVIEALGGAETKPRLRVGAQLVDQETDVDWVVACNNINPQGTAISFAKQGVGPQIIVTDLQQGSYGCNLDVSNLPGKFATYIQFYNRSNYLDSNRMLVDYEALLEEATTDRGYEGAGSEQTTYTKSFPLEVQSSQEPPIFDIQGPFNTGDWMISWSLSCNPE